MTRHEQLPTWWSNVVNTVIALGNVKYIYIGQLGHVGSKRGLICGPHSSFLFFISFSLLLLYSSLPLVRSCTPPASLLCVCLFLLFECAVGYCQSCATEGNQPGRSAMMRSSPFMTPGAHRNHLLRFRFNNVDPSSRSSYTPCVSLQCHGQGLDRARIQ